jgi:hypothetical protein
MLQAYWGNYGCVGNGHRHKEFYTIKIFFPFLSLTSRLVLGTMYSGYCYGETNTVIKSRNKPCK